MPLRDAVNGPGRSEHSERPGFYLTPREIQVLELKATGETIGAIGLRLAISASTVKAHLANIRCKLEAKDTTHAVVLALMWGLIKIDAVLRPRPSLRSAWKNKVARRA
jgi:DNA-binding NarL/FixJ family response regulator